MPSKYRTLIRQIAEMEGVDPDLFELVIGQESSFRENPPDAGQGAIGMAQLMPSTAKELGSRSFDDAASSERTESNSCPTSIWRFTPVPNETWITPTLTSDDETPQSVKWIQNLLFRQRLMRQLQSPSSPASSHVLIAFGRATPAFA